MNKAGRFIKSKVYHIAILLVAALVIILGGIYRYSIAEKSDGAETPLIEELKGEIEILKSTLTKNELEEIESLVDEAIRKVSPVIVAIKATDSRTTPRSVVTYEDSPRKTDYEPAPMPQFEATPSGILLDRAGHILTSADAVRSARQFTIYFGNSVQRIADLVAIDAIERLALLKLRQLDFAIRLPDFARDTPVRTGAWLINVGRMPSGRRSLSLSMLSAIRQDSSGRESFHLNTRVSPELDGSPSVSLEGGVIGINIYLPESSDGYGLTIPIGRALNVAERLKSGVASTPQSWIGLELQDIDENLKRYFAVEQGVMIISIKPDSPASKAGLKVSDLITEIDAVAVSSAKAVIEEITGRPAGTILRLTVRRNGTPLSIDVQTAPLADATIEGQIAKDSSGEQHFGIELSTPSSREGAEIKSVRLHAQAYLLGLKAGDVIVEVNGVRIRSRADFLQRQKAIDADKEQLWQIEREGRRFFIAISGGRKAS
ncbi:MAG: PDZ domain-containing protein [Acidobacteriota bacterium]